jgi:hypothetical protein
MRKALPTAKDSFGKAAWTADRGCCIVIPRENPEIS